MNVIDITVSIGTNTDTSVDVTISDDNGWSPDLLEMATTRAHVSALLLWRELHPVDKAAT